MLMKKNLRSRKKAAAMCLRCNGFCNTLSALLEGEGLLRHAQRDVYSLVQTMTATVRKYNCTLKLRVKTHSREV